MIVLVFPLYVLFDIRINNKNLLNWTEPNRIPQKLKIYFIFQTFPENHLGRVYYNVYYDYISEELTVQIQRIKNLPKSTRDSGITNKTYMK